MDDRVPWPAASDGSTDLGGSRVRTTFLRMARAPVVMAAINALGHAMARPALEIHGEDPLGQVAQLVGIALMVQVVQEATAVVHSLNAAAKHDWSRRWFRVVPS